MDVPSAADESIGRSSKLRKSPHPAVRRNIMARFKPGCLGIRSVILVTLVAVLAMVFMVSPVAANCGPDTKINPNMNEPLEEHPWVDEADGQASRTWFSQGYVVMHVACWLVDAGLLPKSDNSQAKCPGTGNPERNTADGTEDLTALE